MLISKLRFIFPIIYKGNISLILIVIGRFVRCLNSWAEDASEQCEQCRVIWCIFPLRLNSAADSLTPDCSELILTFACRESVTPVTMLLPSDSPASAPRTQASPPKILSSFVKTPTTLLMDPRVICQEAEDPLPELVGPQDWFRYAEHRIKNKIY